jgi:hypothetical protein
MLSTNSIFINFSNKWIAIDPNVNQIINFKFQNIPSNYFATCLIKDKIGNKGIALLSGKLIKKINNGLWYYNDPNMGSLIMYEGEHDTSSKFSPLESDPPLGANVVHKFDEVVDGVYRCSNLSPDLLKLATEVYHRNFKSYGAPAPGNWPVRKINFEDFESMLSNICDIMLGAMLPTNPDVVIPIPTKADFEEGGSAVAEVNMAVGEQDKNTVSVFDVHCDNDNGGNLVTLIIYLLCTAEKGGNLDIFNNDYELIATISTCGDPSMIVMRGDVLHNPVPIFGKGERVAVVFQFPVLSIKKLE